MDDYNTKIIRYKDKVEIIKYSSMRTRVSKFLPDIESRKKKLSKEEMDRRLFHQVQRIKQKIRYYGLANDFNLFWTLTFNDKLVDANNYQLARKAVVAWLRNQRRKYGKFGYIFLPELHKSGRIHYHGVTIGFEPPLSEARSQKSNRKIKKNGKQIYNSDTWKKGFSTVSHIEESAKVSSYLIKYITKDLIQVPTAFNQPRYLVSKGLKTPTVEYLVYEDGELEHFTPSLVAGTISDFTDEYERSVAIYNLDLTDEGKFSQENTPETVFKLNKKIANSRIRAHTVDDYDNTKE